MNAHIILGVIALMLAGLCYYFVPFPIFFFGGVGAVLTIVGVLISKFMAKKMFPCQLRIWENRRGTPVPIETNRAKRIIDKGKRAEYYQLISGKKFPAPEKKFITSTKKDDYVDVFMPNDDQAVPVVFDNTNELTFNLVEHDDLRTLADLTVKTVEAAKPMPDRIAQFMPVLVIAVTGIVLTVMIVSFLQYFPEFVKGTAGVMSSQIEALKESSQAFTWAVNNFTATIRAGGIPAQPPPVY